MTPKLPPLKEAIPTHFDLFYDGQWHKPKDGSRLETISPGTGEAITTIAQAKADDVEAAVQAAQRAFLAWKNTTIQERATHLRRAAAVLHQHAEELALVDAHNTGNPVAEMIMDAHTAGASLEYFAGLAPMVRGETLPGAFRPDEYLHYTVREPLGVVARIVASNHPLMFAGAKLGAPLAAGNTVVVKPPDQAPLAVLRMAELLADVLPPGVVSVLPGGAECGRALAAHPLVKKVTLIGSVATGKAIQRDAAGQLKPTLLELGGKNCLVAYPDADAEKLAQAVTRGTNFTWAGQSCGSMSRVFLHESLHDEVLTRVVELVREKCQPGDPTDVNTTMGSMISKAAQDGVLGYIESGKAEGARLVCGGGVPKVFKDARLSKGFFVEPTIFADVLPDMRIAREEIFGPVMSVFRWKDEDEVFEIANSTSYGLTASIFTNDILTAQRATRRVEAGFVWVNDVAKHFLNVPFGGFKESGMGKEECLDEMLSFTNTKSISWNLMT
ncbi:hypothetical protein INS49_003490 [Diaporthe citri]|uniref:uncharacterized protein n=1 Tax=Diaporthe citri TaxID=83186 RepID=UPI001C827DAF|nr:uncharacterized protein INS49_003490 [Diaporthe citri]KAG6355528.1 hypothetical protein INS49_003490 [Diaporthe citri]